MNVQNIASFTNIVKFCIDNYYFYKSINLSFGPLGTQLRRNLLNECNKFIKDPYIVSTTSLSNILHSPRSRPKHFQDCLQHYPQFLTLLGNRLPFGLYDESNVHSENLDEFFGNENVSRLYNYKCNKTLTSVLLLFFCAPKKSAYFFDYWHRKRLLWWKKFSGTPSNFSTSDISTPNSVLQHLQLQYNFLNEPFPIEYIFNYGSGPLEEFSKITGINCKVYDGKTNVLPHIIACQTTIEQALLIYLLDAFDETDQGVVMRLHHCLAPYKMAVSRQLGSQNKLNNLAEFLQLDLHSSGINVLPNSDLYTEKPLELQFKRFDELAIPYAIELNDETLTTGIAGLRNRETTLKVSLGPPRKLSVLQFPSGLRNMPFLNA